MAAEVMKTEGRRDAEFALDAWMFPVGDEVCSRIPQPFFISSEWFQYPANIIKMKKCYLPGRERKMIAIRGSVHQNFADFCHWQNHWIHIHIKRRNRFKELQKDFDRWDSLIEGEDDNLIPGTNIDTINQYVSLQNSTRIEKYNLD